MRHARLFGALVLGVFVFSVPAAAQTFTLSGTVYGGGSPLPNTTVEALNDGTTVVAAQTTSNGAGAYALQLPNGTYDLRVTPPSGSGFGQETIQNIAISGANRPYDIVLLSAGGELRGTVRGYGGAPVSNLTLTVYTPTWQVLASTTTDANGEYRVSLGGGTFLLYLQTPWPPVINAVAPSYYYAYRYNVSVSGPTTFDIDLPVAKVSGVVTDPGGTPVANATVHLESHSHAPDAQTSSNNTQVTTAADGSYEIFGFKQGVYGGSATLTVQPPSGAALSPVTESLTLTGDATRNVTLSALTALTGTVRGHNSTPVAGLNITAYTPSWQVVGSATTDANGQYSLSVGSGVVTLYLQRPWPPVRNAAAPDYYYAYRYSVTVSGATTFDVTLPVGRVSGIVKDASGVPLANATVYLDSTSYGPDEQYNSNNTSTTTDATGYYEILGFSSGVYGGSATLSIRPPAGANASTMSETVTLTGDLVRDVTLPGPAFLSGTVRGHGGAPVPNLNITVYTSSWLALASTTTDADGKYSVSLGSATVTLYLQTPWPPTANGVAPNYYYGYHYNVTSSGDTTYDITLPVAKISGLVTDSNGAPVPGVQLQVETQSYGPNVWYNSHNTSTTTNASGFYELMGFTRGEYGGNGTLTVRPPANSGFSISSLNNLALTGDLTQRIILQRPDLSPPQIVAGPFVVHLSDTSVSVSWTTNEAATSRVEFGIGSVTSAVSDLTLTTNHTMTLLDLQPSSIYTYRVASTDGSGNGPVYSALGTFSTQAPPGDITPPVITGGPTVVFVDQTTAIVEWTTDEPATSTVNYGATSDLGSSVSSVAGRFRQAHSMRLTGLTADTPYFAQIVSVDPDGNATSSSVFTFRTLAVPDTEAPAITAGPSIVSVTDTKIIVEWTTNEPATSGVSYNDGTEFFVVSDSTLSRTHRITLSGLSASTMYHITVSSTDAVGNGPTLGGPIDAATDATPDTTAPAISNLRVEDITETSAVVKWTTDESSSSAVDYGVASQVPDNTKADVTAVTEHSLTLTGLQDGTVYYLTVSSIDGSGNKATSGEISFKTVSAFIDTPPTAPGPITAPVLPTRAATVDLSWGASTDDVGVTGYEVLRNGEVIASLPADTLEYSDAASEGTFAYQVRATDTAGYTATSDPVSVTVDRTAPQVSVPQDFTVHAIGASAAVAFSASAEDGVDGPRSVSCSPAPGTFAVGTHTVTCSATDTAGNEGSAAFVVTVKDVTAPDVTVPADQTLEATGSTGATATFSASAADIVDGNVAVSCSPASGSVFPLGTTSVTCTATDAAGNQGSASFSVTVRDTTAPAISAVTPSQRQIWAPNHQMVPLTLQVSVTDAVTAAPVCSIAAISSNEATNATGDGNTAADWSFAGLQFALRAERNGAGSGRIYTITATCVDDAGNSSSSSTTVTVPKSQSSR